jgi:hypothetical protein
MVCSVLVCALSAWAGPNADASITVDQNAATEKVEAVCAHNGIPSTVNVAISVSGAKDLTGFMLRIEYDAAQLKFEKAELVVPGSGATPLLESNGGEPGPTLVKQTGDNTVDIAAGVKSADGVGVSGDGLLVYLTLTRIGDSDCSVSVVKAELSDSKLVIDTVVGE